MSNLLQWAGRYVLLAMLSWLIIRNIPNGPIIPNAPPFEVFQVIVYSICVATLCFWGASRL